MQLIAERYEIVRPIGRGAFGRTFLARDRSADRMVALKMFDRRGDADLKALELFEREATVLRSMRHQGIPEVFGFVRDTWEGAPANFLVMEYVDGTSLEALLAQQTRFDATDIVALFLEMLGILEYLHGSAPPILHRDIKPANIIVRADGRPVLVDFGAVRRGLPSAEESGSTIVGTYGYMPYEQYMGQASPSSDLYSLAATFLHLITGQPPRDFMTEEGRIEVPGELPGDPRLRPLLARLLRPSPAERYATARDVRQTLLSSSVALTIGTSDRTPAVATSDGRSRPVKRAPVELSQLGNAPREITGSTRELLERLAPGTLDMMNAGSKPADSRGIKDYASFAFFSAISLGVLPLVFIGQARARRQRLSRFLRDGEATTAEVLGMESAEVGFSVSLTKVKYEFTVDGDVHRDADVVLPTSANRWRVGDRIEILYIAELDFDSVIVSG